MTGAERIAAERQRQIEGEGWDAEHDDEHRDGELARAAACYALATTRHAKATDPWPWDREWDKRPSPGASVDARVRALVKAGALVAAEIDRLLRGGPRGEESGT